MTEFNRTKGVFLDSYEAWKSLVRGSDQYAPFDSHVCSPQLHAGFQLFATAYTACQRLNGLTGLTNTTTAHALFLVDYIFYRITLRQQFTLTDVKLVEIFRKYLYVRYTNRWYYILKTEL